MIGNVVGNYKITEKIGEGGMGAVYKGVDLMLEREVAIKMLRPELASQPQVVERFRSEAVTLAKLNHPNIATLYTFLRQGEDFFMVMEFVRGETLDDVIRKRGAMSPEQAIPLFCQALEGIEHAHRMEIIHRDIKPANMMLTDTGMLKVMDFGIARVLGSARMTKQGNIVGTIEYMSPEQVRGEEADARSDIYSLGILLYELLTGRVPFHSKSEFELMRSQIEEAPAPPRTFAAHISLPVEQAIMRALAKKPEARYQTAGEFRGVLLTALHGATGAINANTYAAPATRLDEPFPAASSASEAPKETRLGGGAAPMVAAAGGQLKETRLGQGGDFAPAYNQNSPQYAQASGQPSFFSKLNWMHYAGAAVILFALIAAPLAMIGSGGKKTETSPAEINQPAQAAPAQAAPPTEQTAAPVTNQVIPPDATPSGVSIEKAASPDNAGADSGRTTRSRSSRSDTPAQAGDSSSASSSQTTAEQPRSTRAPEKDKPAVAKEPEKKEEPKEEKKKGGGIFGKIKGIFGGDKKEEKKKDKP